MAVIRIPDYLFSGFYYPEILEALLAYTRVNSPELTSESDYEQHIQQLRAFSLVGHLNNTRVDVVANELLLDSAQLRLSVKRLFKLIDYRLKSATPALAELVIRLSAVSSIDIVEYIPIYSQFATEPELGEEIIYENIEVLSLAKTDEISKAFIGISTPQSGVDGVVVTAFPTRFTSVGATFTVADVGRSIWVSTSANGNAGVYIINAFVDANTIEVSGASFIAEVDLSWNVFYFGPDVAPDLNDLVTPVSWLPTDNQPSNALYFCHQDIQWDQIDTVSTSTGDFDTVIEYYDPTYSIGNPNLVIDLGGQIRFNVDSFISPDELVAPFTNYSFADLNITYNPTGKSESMFSLFDGTNNYATSRALFGQTVVDTNALNYTISANWHTVPEFEVVSPDEIRWINPMTIDRRWTKTTINSYEGYWLRIRIRGLTPATVPSTWTNMRLDGGNQYFPFQVTQGTTIPNEVLGSSNGNANQRFTTLQGPVFDGSYVNEVDEVGGGSWVPWIEKPNFLNSSATDRHYETDTDNTNDRLIYIYGDGSRGSIPPIGVDNLRSTYRVGGSVDGNVGANKITSNIDSISFVDAISNPMPAIGWTIKEGGDQIDLENTKEAGPASIRNQSKAVSPPDIPRVAVEEYRTEEGAALIARAFAIEEAYGPKTVELVVVGNGGQFLNTDQLQDIEDFYNGDKYTVPPIEGVLLLNSELTAVNYDPKAVDVDVTVIGKGITQQQVVNAIIAFLQPLSLNEDGTYAFKFGGRVATVMIDCAIKDISSNITNVHRTVPASDILLGSRQLPIPGTITVAIQETE